MRTLALSLSDRFANRFAHFPLGVTNRVSGLLHRLASIAPYVFNGFTSIRGCFFRRVTHGLASFVHCRSHLARSFLGLFPRFSAVVVRARSDEH
jgi:hypothetical protein